MSRALAATITGSLIGFLLAGLVCWVWLSTIDGMQLDT